MQYTSHYVLYWVFSHDMMITVFLVIIAAAELQGHKPWRENAGGTHIYFTFQRDTFLYQTPLISINCMFCFMNPHTTQHGHL